MMSIRRSFSPFQGEDYDQSTKHLSHEINDLRSECPWKTAAGTTQGPNRLTPGLFDIDLI
jgi:hypothetical protein